jgi:hypothetical protein
VRIPIPIEQTDQGTEELPARVIVIRLVRREMKADFIDVAGRECPLVPSRHSLEQGLPTAQALLHSFPGTISRKVLDRTIPLDSKFRHQRVPDFGNESLRTFRRSRLDFIKSKNKEAQCPHWIPIGLPQQPLDKCLKVPFRHFIGLIEEETSCPAPFPYRQIAENK